MQAWKITDVKEFMNQMLCKEAFDEFLLSEAQIITKATYTIDGHCTDEYYTPEELQERGLLEQPRLLSYGEVRNFCLDIIRGKKTPVFFKFVFEATDQKIETLLQQHDMTLSRKDVTALVMNVRFQQGKLTVTSGTALTVFTMDRSLEKEWDMLLEHFFIQLGVDLERIS